MSAVHTPHSRRSPPADPRGPDVETTPPRPTESSTETRRRQPQASRPDLLWELKQLHNIAVRLEERIGDLYWDLYRRRPASVVSSAHDGGQRPRSGGRATVPPATTPVAWVTKLVTHEHPDGSLLVSLNGKPPFLLQPHLGALFLALSEDTGLSRDEGVGFKTLRDLSVRVGKRTGARPLSPDTINKYVCKLRKLILSRTGLRTDFIQTNRRLGRRLAVKRSSRPVT